MRLPQTHSETELGLARVVVECEHCRGGGQGGTQDTACMEGKLQFLNFIQGVRKCHNHYN